MKKVLFLTFSLSLFTLGTVNVNGQVAIGKAESPHPGAVLDLKSTTQGVLLPNVSLSNNATDFILSGDKAAAKGLVVYNNGEIPGLYIWDGIQWNRLNSCVLPVAPNIVSAIPSTPVVPNALFSIYTNAVVNSTGYEWHLPDSLQIEGIDDGRSIWIRVKKTTAGTIDASQISVKAKNACGVGPAVNASAGSTITVEENVPATPTFSIARTTINSNASITLTCGDVGADTYEWTFPGAFSGTTPTTVNKIKLQASVDGKYAANLFSVQATNAYGSSTVRTATGDSIIVEDCGSTPPVMADILGTVWATRLVDTEQTFSLNYSTRGNTAVNIELPTGLSLVSKGWNHFKVRCDKPGHYRGEDMIVSITNDCGTTTGTLVGIFEVRSSLGEPGPDTVIGDHTYPTWYIPGSGLWMRGFSREGTVGYKHPVPGSETDTVGYYTHTDYVTACPDGWKVPTREEARIIYEVLNNTNSETKRELGLEFDMVTNPHVYDGNAMLPWCCLNVWTSEPKGNYDCNFNGNNNWSAYQSGNLRYGLVKCLLKQ